MGAKFLGIIGPRFRRHYRAALPGLGVRCGVLAASVSLAAMAHAADVVFTGYTDSTLWVVGDSNTLTTTGVISPINDGGGLDVTGSSNTLRNTGEIYLRGYGSGLYAKGSSNTLTNSGLIETRGPLAYGLQADGSTNTLMNIGTISTSGPAAWGLFAGGASNTLTNSGTIKTLGAASHGLLAGGSSNTLTNSGTITTSGTGSYAIYIADGGTGNRVVLLSGASLSGAAADLYLGSGTDVTVDMDSSAVWSYGGTLSSLTGQGTTLVGATSDTIAVASASGEAVATSVAASRGMAVSGMLAQVAQQSAASSVRVASAGDVDMPTTPKWTAWSMGYGEKTQRNTSEGAAFSATLWGGAVGLDRHLDNGLAVGAFAGTDETRTWVNRRNHRITEDSRYLGLRLGADDDEGVFWSGAAYGGVGEVKSRRAVDGADPSHYDTDTVFGGLTGVAGYRQILGMGYGATYRARANYDARRTDGYTETIGGVDMDVDDRLSQSIGGRAEVGLDFWGAERHWQVSPRIGVEGWHAVGGDSTGARFGSNAYRVSDDATCSFGFVTGLDAAYRFDTGIRLSTMVEGRRDNDGTTTTQGSLQVSVPF